MPWQFTDGHLLRRLLKLQHLLIDKLAFLMHDNVGIQWTFCSRFVARLRRPTASSRQCQARETTVYVDVVGMSTTTALDVDNGCLG